MPLYEYKCTNCGRVSEFILKVGDAPMDGCKLCGEKRLERILYSKFVIQMGGTTRSSEFAPSPHTPLTRTGKARSSLAIGSEQTPRSCETSGTCMGPCGDDSCRMN